MYELPADGSISRDGAILLGIAVETAGAVPGGTDTARTFYTESGLDSAVVNALLTFVVGGGIVTIRAGYADRVTERARSEPGWSLVVGFGAFLLVVGLLFVGVATVVLALVAIPVFLGFIVLTIFGTVVGQLALGTVVTDSLGGAVLVAVCVSFATGAVPAVGSLVGAVVAFLGVGAVLTDVRSADRAGVRGRGGGADW